MSDDLNNKRSRTLSMVALVIINIILIVAFIAIVFFGPLLLGKPSISKQQPIPPKTSFVKGETAQFEKLRVTATAVQRGWQPNNQFIIPTEGNEFTLVTLNLKNTDTEPITVSPADFTLGVNGVVVNHTIKVIPANPLAATEMKPGAEFSGDIVFEIKKDSTRLTLQYQMYDTTTQKNITYSLGL